MSEKYKLLKFNVFDVEHGEELLIRFPELKQIEAFRDCISGDRNRIIRYICYLYDPGSPLQSEYQDLKARKEAAAELAGFKRNSKGLWPESTQDIFNVINKGDVNIVDMVFEFLRIINDKTWMILKVNEINFWEYSLMLMENISGKNSKEKLDAANVKTKLREELKIIASDTELYMKKMFGDEENLQALAKEKLKRITPETVGSTLNGKHK